MTDLLRADVRAHCAIGERALPECAHKKRLLAHLVSLRFAAERRAALCVFDRRRRDARDEKKPGPASMASDAKTTSKTEKRKPNDLVRDSFGETDRVEWQLTASASRTDNGKDDPWWFADGVVVLVTAADAEAREENENENENENVSEAPAPRGDDDDDDDDDDEKTKPRRTVSTQFPDARFFDEFAETARTRETTWASESPSARLVSEKKNRRRRPRRRGRSRRSATGPTGPAPTRRRRTKNEMISKCQCSRRPTPSTCAGSRASSRARATCS